VRIDTQTPTGKCDGTGFLFTVEVASDGEPDGTRTFVVTNRHVVEDATTIELSMLQDWEGVPVLGSDTGFVFPGSTDAPTEEGSSGSRVFLRGPHLEGALVFAGILSARAH
jgi:hypothetical protein